uniref:Uncharacterized protein n=1 Tax=Anopheles culicifacies TaxID=139723 RepID=A0A182ML52_9DIPT
MRPPGGNIATEQHRGQTERPKLCDTQASQAGSFTIADGRDASRAVFDITDPRNGSKILSLQHPYHHHHHPNAGSTLEGRTIEYRPGGGLDYHNSPLMAEIPTGDYSHIHRSIDQLRSMNERGVLGQLNALQHAAAAVGNGTDLRSALVHDYKPAPSTPPTPLAIVETQMAEPVKVRHWKEFFLTAQSMIVGFHS